MNAYWFGAANIESTCVMSERIGSTELATRYKAKAASRDIIQKLSLMCQEVGKELSISTRASGGSAESIRNASQLRYLQFVNKKSLATRA